MDNTLFSKIKLAIKGAGGFSAVARQMKPPVSRQAVFQWANDTKVPPDRVDDLSRIINLKPDEIRPDKF